MLFETLTGAHMAVQLVHAEVTAEEQQQSFAQEKAGLQASFSEAQGQLQAQLQQLTSAHRQLQDGSSTYQQELEGTAVGQPCSQQHSENE